MGQVVERALWDHGRLGLSSSLPLVDRLDHNALKSPALIFLCKLPGLLSNIFSVANSRMLKIHAAEFQINTTNFTSA